MQFNNNRTALAVVVALMVVVTGCLGGATQVELPEPAEQAESAESTKSGESAESTDASSSVESSGKIDISVSGAIAPGNTVVLTATLDGNPVSGADVFVKDGNGDRQFVGRTNERGELNVKVRLGELEGEFEFDN